MQLDFYLDHLLAIKKKKAYLKWNSRQKATKALFGTEYESNLRVKA